MPRTSGIETLRGSTIHPVSRITVFSGPRCRSSERLTSNRHSATAPTGRRTSLHAVLGSGVCGRAVSCLLLPRGMAGGLNSHQAAGAETSRWSAPTGYEWTVPRGNEGAARRPAREATGSMAGPSVGRIEKNGPFGYRGKPVFFSGRTGRNIRRQTRRSHSDSLLRLKKLGYHEEITCSMAVLSAADGIEAIASIFGIVGRSAESPPHCSAFDTQPSSRWPARDL